MLSFVLIALAAWGGILLTWLGLSRYLRKADAGRLKQRLAGSKVLGKRKKEGKSARTPVLFQKDSGSGLLISGLLKRFRLQARVSELLEQAGLRWSAGRFLHACLGLFLAAFAVAWLMLPTAYQQLSFLPALAAGAAPVLFVLQKRRRRLHRFEALFPDSLEFVARSMRAGHAFSVSLEMIHKEFQEPLAGEFRRSFEEHNLGLPLDAALQKLSKRVPSLDVHFFVSAVILQKRTGGNLAEILDKLAYVIRERFKLRGRVRAISAHGRMTGLALTLIPVGVGIMMFVVNPDYIRFFFEDEIGHYMMGAAVGLQLLGYAIIKKIVKIEV
jgi:tight adherence protein B